MKTIATLALALCLATGPAAATPKKSLDTTSVGIVTEQEVSTCIVLGELAESFLVAKNEGVGKYALYNLLIEEKVSARDTKLAQGIIEAVYSGVTPDHLFDLCMEQSLKN